MEDEDRYGDPETNRYVKKYAETIGDGLTTKARVNHGLNTRDVVIAVYEIASGEQQKDIRLQVIDKNTVGVSNTRIPILAGLGVSQPDSKPIPKDGWRVVVIG